MVAAERFGKVQRIGERKEKESLERARAVTYRQQSMQESQLADNFTSSSPQTQQQVVLPMEQNVDVAALTQRDEHLRKLQVCDLFKEITF